jgi:hypothetical protein
MTNPIDITSMTEQLQSYLDMGMNYDDFTDDEKSFMQIFMMEKNNEKTETNKKNGQRRKTRNYRIRTNESNIPRLPRGE